MINLMFCRHYITKWKLVSWATDCKNEHEQGFVWMKCCADCGCIVKGESNGARR